MSCLRKESCFDNEREPLPDLGVLLVSQLFFFCSFCFLILVLQFLRRLSQILVGLFRVDRQRKIIKQGYRRLYALLEFKLFNFLVLRYHLPRLEILEVFIEFLLFHAVHSQLFQDIICFLVQVSFQDCLYCDYEPLLIYKFNH